VSTVSVRYIVDDVDDAIRFYGDLLGLALEMRRLRSPCSRGANSACF